MLGRCFVHFVFHLEHYGNELRAVLRLVTEDEIALTARTCVVVLFKIGVRECGRTQSVELGQAMLFKTFADHLG